MLDDLVKVIETLKERIRSHGDAFRENEIRTRMALIDPLLQALGWDTADPAAVVPEFSVGSLRADYALLDPDSRPAATVEAKKLGEALHSHRTQMVTQAVEAGVTYAALSDGNVWELYEVFRQIPLRDKRILNVSVADLPAHEIALKMLLLWRPNLSSRQPVQANEPIVRPRSQAEAATQTAENTAPADEAARRPENNRGWIALQGFTPQGGANKPTAIRFPDRSERPLNFWWHLIHETANWLGETGRLTQENIPVMAGRGQTYLINREARHLTGRRFASRRTLRIGETEVFVNTAFDKKSTVRHTRSLLKHCDENPADVFVQVGNQP